MMTQNEENLANHNVSNAVDEEMKAPNSSVDYQIKGWATKWDDGNPTHLYDQSQLDERLLMKLFNGTFALTIPYEDNTNEFFIWRDPDTPMTLVSCSRIKEGKGWSLNLLIPNETLKSRYDDDPFPFLEHLIKNIKKTTEENWKSFIPENQKIKPHDASTDRKSCVKILLTYMGQSTALLESSVQAMYDENTRLLLLHNDTKAMLEIAHALLFLIPRSERKRFTCAVNMRKLPTDLIKKKYKVLALVQEGSRTDLQTYVKLLEDDSEQGSFILDLKKSLTGGVVFLTKPIPWLEDLSFQLSTALKLGEEQRAVDVLKAIEELDEVVQLELRLSQLPDSAETVQQCFNAATMAEKHSAEKLVKILISHGVKIACRFEDFTETFNTVNKFINQFRKDEDREEILATFRTNMNVTAFKNTMAVFHANWIRWFHQLYLESREKNTFRTKRELTRLWMSLQEHLIISEERVLPLVLEVLNGFYLAKEDVDKIIFDLISNEKTPLDLRIKIMKESINRGYIDERKIRMDPFEYVDEYLPKLSKYFRILTVIWISIPWKDPISSLLLPTVKKLKKRSDFPLHLRDFLKFLHDILSIQTFQPRMLHESLEEIYKPISLNNSKLKKKVEEIFLLILHDPSKYQDLQVTRTIAIIEREYHLLKARKAKQQASRIEHLKEAFIAALLTPETADEISILTTLIQEKLSATRTIELGWFLVNSIKKLGTHAALHVTTTLHVYTKVLAKASRLTNDQKIILE